MLLVYGANRLVDGASALARRFRVSSMVIGLTIVALGTSTPELVVNVIAATGQNTGIVLGNILGSNLLNILMILGISAMIYPLLVRSNTTWVEIPLCLLAALVVFVMGSDVFLNGGSANVLSRSDGLVLLAFFAIFMGYTLHMLRTETYTEEPEMKDHSKVKAALLIVLGLALSIAGGKLIVTGAVDMARMMGLSERVIALTIVALGTSLPELATSVIAVRKKHADLAIGNVVGSNIFNTFLVLGISAVIHPVTIPAGGVLDFWVNIGASLLLFLFVFTGKGRRISRLEGLLFVLIYIVYVAVVLIQA